MADFIEEVIWLVITALILAAPLFTIAYVKKNNR